MSDSTSHRARRAGAVHVMTPDLIPVEGVAGRSTRWSACLVGVDMAADTLWYEVPAEHTALLTRSLDPAILALLVPCMARGVDLVLEGAASPELVAAADGELQSLLRSFEPELHRIRVVATPGAGAPTVPQRTRGIAVGFSAGVDSYYTVLRELPSVTTLHGPMDGASPLLVFSNVGSHGVRGREVFVARRERLLAVAGELGLPLVTVDTDMDDLYSLPFLRTHVLRNASVAHLLGGGVARYLSSSTGGDARTDDGSWDAGAFIDLAELDGVLLPLCSTGSVEVRSAGEGVTRVEKTRVLATEAITFRTLDVCARSRVGSGNCSTCWKCLRTLATLDILGVLDEYAPVFRLRRYRLLRPFVLAHLWVARGRLTTEVLDLALHEGSAAVLRARRWRIPVALGVRAAEVGVRLLGRSPRLVRAALRRVWNRG